jgi:putative ABC transport system permease protein
LGADRRRLVRQLLTENVLLSVVGGALGFWLALWIIRLLLAFKPPIDFPLTVDLSVDWRVLVFTLAISLITGALFGLAPALQATRASITSALKDTADQGGHSRSRLRGTLVVAQLAVSLMILISAGLVARSFAKLQSMNPGFDPRNALTLSFDLGLQGYDDARGMDFQRQTVDRVQSLPGVKSVAIASNIPLSLNYNSTNVYVEGHAPERGANLPQAMTASVSPKYFATMGTRIVEGREFTDHDKKDSESVVIVNETFVRRIIPEAKSPADALNRRISFSGIQGPYSLIVGVAKDGKYFNIAEEPRSFIWSSMAQDNTNGGSLVIRTEGPPEATISAARNVVLSVDPNLPLFDVKTLDEHMQFALFPSRVAAFVLGAFGIVALALAAIGIYGVTAYSVSQRTREIGIRIALGAQLGDVLRMILRTAVILTTIGVVLGLLGAFLLTRALSSLLSGVSATDPVTFIIVSLVMILVALLASYFPARRATKVDPLIALRYE